MAKIIVDGKRYFSPNATTGICLVRCHVEWLKKHGVRMSFNNHGRETQAYSNWANANRAHPLLVECIELYKDAVTKALHDANILIRNMNAAENFAQEYVKMVAQNIIKKKGRGYLSVEKVRNCIEQGMTFEEILDKFQDYRHKSNVHPHDAVASAQKYLKSLQQATQAVLEFFEQSDILDAADVVNGNTNYMVLEYDDTMFTPKIVMEATPMANDDEIDWEYREALHLVPIETEEITEVCLKSFVDEGDHEGLLRYLMERGIDIT